MESVSDEFVLDEVESFRGTLVVHSVVLVVTDHSGEVTRTRWERTVILQSDQPLMMYRR